MATSARSNGKAFVDVPEPNAIEAEQAAIGAGLISASAVDKVLRRRRDAWFLRAHQNIVDAIRALHESGMPADVLTVPERLRDQGLLDQCGGLAYINTLAESVPTAAHVDHYLQIVDEKHALRQLRSASRTITELTETKADRVLEIGQQAEVMLRSALAQLRRNGKFSAGITADALIAEDIPPMKWIVPGLIAEGLTIISGKGKMGKSWLCYQIACAVALGGVALGSVSVEGGRVLYLALEDTKRRLKGRLLRILDSEAPPPRLHLFPQNSWPRMNEGGQRDLIEWFKQYPDTRLVIIDTFAKIRSKSDAKANAYDEDYRAIGEVKDVADAHGAGIIVVHHFNKIKDAEDWVDQVSGSIGITGAADGIIGFFRDRGKPTAILKITGRDIDDESDRALSWSEHGGPWQIEGSAEDYYRTTEEREVLDTLARLAGPTPGKPFKLRDITEALAALGVKPDAGRQRIRRMAFRGVILDHGEGWYSAPVSEKTASGVTDVTDVQSHSVTTKSPPQFDSIDTVDTSDRSDTCDTQTAFSLKNPLPEPLALESDTPNAEADLRQTTFNLAWAKGWPALKVSVGDVAGTEEDWRHVVSLWAPVVVGELKAALEGMG